MSDDDLTARPDGALGLSAHELAAALRDGQVSAAEVMAAALSRAEAVQRQVNAFTWIDPDGALAAARTADERIAAGRAGRLEGVPLAVKELTPVAGQPWTMGSLAFRDTVASITDPALQALIDGGAIPFVRTNSPEFGCASVTDNDLFGETLNPWNRAFSTGGSSGGAGAALASWATPLAQGSDSAGSLRIPAAACGVVGMKPSYAAVPVAAPAYLDRFGHNGPMGRTVADVRLMLEVMARPDDDYLFGARLAERPAVSTLTGLRVLVIDAMDGLDIDDEVAQALRETATLLEQSGAHVEVASFPWGFERLFDAVKQAFAATYMPLARLARDSGGDVTDLTRAFIADVEPVAVDGLHTVRAQQEMANLHRDLAELFRRADILMLPTLAMPAPAAHDRFIDHAPQVNGREHQDRWIVGFTVPFNLVSQCPAVSLPAGWSRDGLPLAVQLVGRPYSDYALLDIAELLETGIRG